jgi:anti-sigma factor RsiW
MNCQQTKTNFDERLDNQLDAAHCAAFDAHVGGCPACATEWRAYAGMWAVVAKQVVPGPSVGFTERTLRRLDENLTEHPRLWLAPLWRWAMAGMLVVTLSTGGWFGWRTQHERKADAQAEVYVMAQQDRLEDFDVVAALHLLNSDNP